MFHLDTFEFFQHNLQRLVNSLRIDKEKKNDSVKFHSLDFIAFLTIWKLGIVVELFSLTLQTESNLLFDVYVEEYA